jgi:hypothetical protein
LFTSSFTVESDDPDNPSVTVNLSGASGTADANTMNSLFPVLEEKPYGMISGKEGGK